MLRGVKAYHICLKDLGAVTSSKIRDLVYELRRLLWRDDACCLHGIDQHLEFRN